MASTTSFSAPIQGSGGPRNNERLPLDWSLYALFDIFVNQICDLGKIVVQASVVRCAESWHLTSRAELALNQSPSGDAFLR